MGARAKKHRRRDRAGYSMTPEAWWLGRAKAQNRILFDTAHLGSGRITPEQSDRKLEEALLAAYTGKA